MLTLDTLQQNFPPHTSLPSLLIHLYKYERRQNMYYSGYFELIGHGKDSVYYWFDKDERVAKHFAMFGAGPDGSLYGYWLYDEQGHLEQAPIVFLGSEGVGNTILANTFEDFLALLSMGYSELGYAISYPKERAKKNINNQLFLFREWLLIEFGIQMPEEPNDIVENARKSHPDLDEWIDGWMQAKYRGEV